MGVGARLYMYVVVVQKFTFAISSPDEFLFDPPVIQNSLRQQLRFLEQYIPESFTSF